MEDDERPFSERMNAILVELEEFALEGEDVLEHAFDKIRDWLDDNGFDFL